MQESRWRTAKEMCLWKTRLQNIAFLFLFMSADTGTGKKERVFWNIFILVVNVNEHMEQVYFQT